MAEAPITPDPEQQRADNEASRRQSGLDPELDREQDRDAGDEKGGPGEGNPRDAGRSGDSASSGSGGSGASGVDRA